MVHWVESIPEFLGKSLGGACLSSGHVEQREIVKILDGISDWCYKLSKIEKDVWNSEVGGYFNDKFRLPVSKDLQDQIIEIG